ncbi:MAG: 4'-phosphopantetheinyl transferase superfamily protein [Ignavibacteriaceae bacterium]|nr:4'-phosphopantetheinyl transferase superfamily protein [Ignavibacteriaceae bacterium]
MNKRTYNPNHQGILLNEKEIHIWNFDLNNISMENKQALKVLLSKDELERASKFHFDIDRERFICGSGLLRLFISLYTNISPKIISYKHNNYGKPELSGEQNKGNLHFNMSHSQNMLCIGFLRNEQIGVDIEVIKPIKDYIDVANKFFSDFEIVQLNSFPEEKALEAFYTCWTGKEAFIKLSGEGLSYPLKDFATQIKELNNDETFRYKLQVKKSKENFFVEAFRLQKDLVGASAFKNELIENTYWFFEENRYSINKFINDALS